MAMEAIGVAVGVAEGFVDGFFYDRQVDKLSDAVEKIMANAHQKAQSLMADGFSGLTVQQIEFFSHVDLSLQGVKNIYETEMHLTVDKVDKKAQAILATVDTIVHNWNRELISPQIQQLIYQARSIVNSLPFTNNRPKLSAFSPAFVAPSSRPLGIVIKCIGNFPSLPDSKVRPTLHFNQKEYPSIRNQPDIAFAVPLHDLFPLGGNSVHGIRSASFDVKIPYTDQSYWSYFLSFFQSLETYDTYQGSVCLLPESPGKMTIYYTKLREVVERESITSQEYVQSSRREEYMGESKTSNIYKLKAKAGWKIDQGSVDFHVFESKGDKEHIEEFKNRWELIQVTPEQATYLVTTQHYERPGHCGKIRFKISATQSRTHLVPETTKEEYVLKWGESRVIDESKGSWVIHFDSFDGIHNQVPGYGVSRFFRVQSFGGKPVLAIDAPEQVTSHFLLSNDEASFSGG